MAEISSSTVSGPVMQVGAARNVVQIEKVDGNVYLTAAERVGVAEDADEWVEVAARSRVWNHLRKDREVEPYRSVALEAVAELAGMRDSVDLADLADDPWQDPGIAVRFASRVDWLLGDDHLDLYPAEAALLVVLPFVYRVRALRLAASRVSVRPTDLRPSPGAEGARASYERFIESYDLLTRRAPAAPLGWWLFHRWLDQHEDLADPEGVQEILDRLPMLAALQETFATERVCTLLHGLRRGPDVGSRDHLAHLRVDNHLRAPGDPHLQEQRLALLLALAYGTAIEMTALPEIVAEHLGIPHEVDLADLRKTLDEAAWGGPYDLPVLRAECHHEAVVEGLREYTARTDELLHAVRRVLTSHPLPTRLTSDEAAPAAGAFTGWARFRLDERRVRSLLMGVELYRDRDLAVRELYQNALDACRYARARVQYLDRSRPSWLGGPYSYEGRIRFRQGVDETGRAYLECEDNGVGMGEEELRGVFSNAGARFAEQLDFKLERARWRKVDPPVELYPNSRFGIGVLSYFMLADEIRVTTCRLDATGQLGPRLEVAIHGPSHLFRIVERAARGCEPGTTVRLYLREDIGLGESWSVLTVLERLLGIAEFHTTATHGEGEAVWEPGVFRRRDKPRLEEFGLDGSGIRAPWREAPPGAQVIWCEHGGALLVDGLLVEPEVSRGVFPVGGRGLVGAVVNLFGPLAPGKLSVDRRRVMGDVSGVVAELLAGAAGDLVRSGLLGMEWIGRVVAGSAHLADLVTAEAVRQSHVLESGEVTFDVRRTGLFLPDSIILGRARGGRPQDKGLHLEPPDHVLLWRLLAHRQTGVLAQLGAVHSELPTAEEVRVAMPSDLVVLASHWSERTVRWRERLSDDWLPVVTHELGVTVGEAERRARRLGLRRMGERSRPAGSGEDGAPATEAERNAFGETVRELTAAMVADPVFLGGTRRHLMPVEIFERDGTVVPGHLARASLELGMSVPDVCEAFARHGIAADPVGLPSRPTEEDVRFLSRDLDGSGPWLHRSVVVPVRWILRAAEREATSAGGVVARLTAFGFAVPVVPADATTADAELFGDGRANRGRHMEGVPYERIFRLVEVGRFTLQEVLDRYRAYGFAITLSPPEVLTPLDLRLFSTHGAMNWSDIGTAERVPFAELIRAAPSFGLSPDDLARHLRSRGLVMSCEALPEELMPGEAADLLRALTTELRRRGAFLAVLLGVAHRSGRPAWQIHGWLREWGVRVPDLADIVRDALARVPRADPV
ncbi:ATP-binding protein [Kitasatospora sp. NPDC056783]|uniref:HD domain-containing protein n=1 Tax=Kitasatospora sp. NPDC056783 TaxID=3345943 RepID=UPI0036D0A847